MSEVGPRLPDPRMIPPWQAATAPPPGQEPASPPDGQPPPDPADSALIRPFLVTGGRTQPLRDGLRIETMVAAQPAALSAPLRFELRRIVELCQSPHSVAEIAVRLEMPLGVARVLIADLVGSGHAICTEPAEIPIDVIERIRDRVRSL